MKVKIFGAGSIGNHLAYACRSQNLDVTIFDIDDEALVRTKNKIYTKSSRHSSHTRRRQIKNNEINKESKGC